MPHLLVRVFLIKSKPPNKQKDESLEIQRPEDIPGYYEYQKFVNLLVEGIDYEDFGQEKCESEFIETYMMQSKTYKDSLPRQKSGIKSLMINTLKRLLFSL